MSRMNFFFIRAIREIHGFNFSLKKRLPPRLSNAEPCLDQSNLHPPVLTPRLPAATAKRRRISPEISRTIQHNKNSSHLSEKNQKIPKFPQTFPPPHRLNSRERYFKKGGLMPSLKSLRRTAKPSRQLAPFFQPPEPPSITTHFRKRTHSQTIRISKRSQRPPAAQQKHTRRNNFTPIRPIEPILKASVFPNEANAPPAAQRTTAHHGAPFFARIVKSNPPATLSHFAPSSQLETRFMAHPPHHHQPPEILSLQPPLPSLVY